MCKLQASGVITKVWPMRHTENGNDCLNVHVACDKGTERPEYIKIVLWEEAARKYEAGMIVGRQLYFEGEPWGEGRWWNGKVIVDLKIKPSMIEFLDQ